jgi:hypothetical protein
VNFRREPSELVDTSILEKEARSSNQITDRIRHEGLTGACCACNSRGNMDRNAANLVTLHVDLADMETTTDCNTKLRDRVGDYGGTTHCPRWAIENTDKPITPIADIQTAKSLYLISRYVVVSVEQDSPCSVSDFRHLLGRVHDIGDEDGDKHSIQIFLDRRRSRSHGLAANYPEQISEPIEPMWTV